MSLGKTFRFGIHNETGQEIDADECTIKANFWDIDGAFSGEVTVFSNDAAIGSGAYIAYDTYDNSTNQYVGGTFELEVTYNNGDTPDGNVEVYIEYSTDGGTSWPDQGGGDPTEAEADLIKVLNIPDQTVSGTEVFRTSFRL